MRQFKCAECGHEFEVAHGTGGPGQDLKCPLCGGVVHRLDAGGPPGDRGASQRGASQRGTSQPGASQPGAPQAGASQRGASQRGADRRGASQRGRGQRAGKDPDAD